MKPIMNRSGGFFHFDQRGGILTPDQKDFSPFQLAPGFSIVYIHGFTKKPKGREDRKDIPEKKSGKSAQFAAFSVDAHMFDMNSWGTFPMPTAGSTM